MLKKNLVILAILVVFAAFFSWKTWYISAPTPFVPLDHNASKLRIVRLSTNPLIDQKTDFGPHLNLAQTGFLNISSPALIKVPNWVKNRLGHYYLYFSHPRGNSIGLAFANRIEGPWKIYHPGTLKLNQSYFAQKPPKISKFRSLRSLFSSRSSAEFWPLLRLELSAEDAVDDVRQVNLRMMEENFPHISNPDVIVDENTREIRMYFHGLTNEANELSRVATSADGIHFTVLPKIIAAPNLRVFKFKGLYYGIATPGLLYRSVDGLQDFEVRPKPLASTEMRHVGLWLDNGLLYIFWSRVGDAPERILYSQIKLVSNDWRQWKLSEPIEVLRPEYPWEGADLPVEPSTRNLLTRPKNQVRDPFVFINQDRTYLLYSIAGEAGIAIASISKE